MSKLVTEFVHRDITLFDLFSEIKEDVWADFYRVKNSKEFMEKGMKARELALTFKHPHKMGIAGYAGMHTVWRTEDDEAEKNGLPIPFGHIMFPRTRAWSRARATCDKYTCFV